jgi:hypothetical protein
VAKSGIITKCPPDQHAGGWSAIKALRRIGAYQKGDERILGDSDFVKKVLAQALVNFFKLRP